MAGGQICHPTVVAVWDTAGSFLSTASPAAMSAEWHVVEIVVGVAGLGLAVVSIALGWLQWQRPRSAPSDGTPSVSSDVGGGANGAEDRRSVISPTASLASPNLAAHGGQSSPSFAGARSGLAGSRSRRSSRILPSPLTPLVGRDDDVAKVSRLVGAERLVTLTGSAGVGKSRLALALARRNLGDGHEVVWWVELAPVSEPDGVGRAILAAAGAPEFPGAPIAQGVAAELAERSALLVLDGCEQLLGATAEIVAELLTSIRSLSVLATSLEPLMVPGEVIWRVPSLSTPQERTAPAVADLMTFDAVKLFVERARRARSSFELTPESAASVAQICRRLDGIPLAIELAAARCRHTSAQRIASELDDRFRTLTLGPRAGPSRHQTLVASLDWSHDRLSTQERRVFRRLGVFAGAIPFDAARAVVTDPGDIRADDASMLVGRLVDKSLVVALDDDDGMPRYRLLESLRHYACDQAREAGELPSMEAAHAMWWLDWLESLDAMAPSDDVVAKVDCYHDNLRRALGWCVGADPGLGLRLLGALARPWQTLGRAGDVLAVADRLLTPANADRYPLDWFRAAAASAIWFSNFGRSHDFVGLLDRMEQVAMDSGDAYFAAITRWYRTGFDSRSSAELRERAAERGEVWLEAIGAVSFATWKAIDEPSTAGRWLDEADDLVKRVDNRYLRDVALSVHAITADLQRSRAIGRELLGSPAGNIVMSGIRVLNTAAFLAGDTDGLRLAVAAAKRAQHSAPGVIEPLMESAEHRLRLLEGEPRTTPFRLTDYPLIGFVGPELLVECRDAIDAGYGDDAIRRARQVAGDSPSRRALLALVEALVLEDRDRFCDVLTTAVDSELLIFAVDACEGLAAVEASDGNWPDALRLLTVAEHLRDMTGYRWRFPSERHKAQATRAAAEHALGRQAKTVIAEAAHADWHDVVIRRRFAGGS